MYLIQGLLLLLLVPTITAKCYDVFPAFPVPEWPNCHDTFKPALERIIVHLNDLMSDPKYDSCSFSMEVTSSSQRLLAGYHTAYVHNETRPGDTRIDWDSLYRIASITKVFTTLGVLYQHEAGNLSLDDPITNYIPELAEEDTGEIPWKDITLRILASQLSGIPREFAQSDLINYLPNPTELGLPPASKEGLPKCDEYDEYKPCNRSQFLKVLKQSHPLFAPNQKSTYSNLNFELLGLALENVTGISYAEYMQTAIFDPLNMSSTTLAKPDSDEHAVLPTGPNYWDVDEGIQSPTGGIYSSSNDMSKFVRYILTHYNALATGVNWFMPASWAGGTKSFYGMPFEIFRTDDILLESKRPVTFTTKAGGVPGYFSRIMMLEEYGLGFTFLVAGTDVGVELLAELQEIVTVEIVRQAEAVVWDTISDTHAGSYVAQDKKLNSSITLTASPSTGLIISNFISNGTDVLKGPLPGLIEPSITASNASWRIQLTPTLLYKSESAQQGEIWKMIVVLDRPDESEQDGKVFDEFCHTDVDYAAYAGISINEMVFWREEGVVEMPAWRVKMERWERGGLVEQMEGKSEWKVDL